MLGFLGAGACGCLGGALLALTPRRQQVRMSFASKIAFQGGAGGAETQAFLCGGGGCVDGIKDDVYII